MNNLQVFKTHSFIQALKSFFKDLKVPMNYVTDEPTTAKEILKDTYKDNDTFQLIDNVYFVGMVDDAAFNVPKTSSFGNITTETGSKINSPEVDYKINSPEAGSSRYIDYDGMLVFGITLKDRPNDLLPTRSQLAEISRAFNREFYYTPVVVVFKYGNYLAFANTERLKYKQEWREGEKAGKVSLIYNINTENLHEGHRRILLSLNVEKIRERDRKNKVTTFRELNKGWHEVFNTNVLGKQFYLDYSKLSVQLIQTIYPKQVENKLIAHQGVLNLLNRIMFIYFVQKKEWIMKDENFIIHFWNDYQMSGNKNSFHEEWLNAVFFSAFNGIAYKSPKVIKALPEPYKSEIINFPYLNGGLFAFNEEYDNFILPDSAFEDIFNFFESYIFTISEDTPYDVNLEINPELLGKMYEGMINATDLDDVDAENGIIYTERSEINFMTRRSFVEVLDKKMNGIMSREFLYHFVFDEPEQKHEVLKRYKANTKDLRKAITSITACDPACGSGSMLLGVIQLQMELLRGVDMYDDKPHSSNDDFLIKKQLIGECIYGVDIKEWAVRIAELRLWLYMIAEADFQKDELTKTPLLPNLDFKLRKGNSLLQKIGSLDFSIEELLKGRNKAAGATRKLNEFIKKKKQFIVNQEESNTTYKKLKAEEFAVFNSFIDELIIEKRQLIHNRGVQDVKQLDIFGNKEPEQKNIFEQEIQGLNSEIEQLKKLKATIHKEKKLPFSYDIDFMEVFLTTDDPGFDLIIGNPPYVRQEQILPPEDGEYLEYLLLPENKGEKAKVNKTYKEELSNKVYKTHPFLSTTVKTQIDGKNKTIPVYGSKVPGQSDLYCYFQMLCPAYLNSNGTFCFIISNSWLDVEFGSYIQHFLLKHTKLHAVYDCNVRSFDAKVNTVIYIHSALQNNSETREAYYKTLKPIDHIVHFVMNKIDYTQAAYAPILLEQEHAKKNTFQELYRIIPKNQIELFALGYDDGKVKYAGDKWGGKYLKAPEIYYSILDKGESKLVRLGTIADIYSVSWSRLGFNDELMFKKTEQRKTKNKIVPVLKSPRDVKKISLSNSDTTNYLIKRNDISNKIIFAELLWVDLRNDKHLCHLCTEEIAFTHNFHGIKPKGNYSLELCSYLNSSLSCLFIEIIGRGNLGEGAIRILANDLGRHFPSMIIPKKSKLNGRFFQREQNNIFTELGFDKNIPIREQQPNPLPDRKELDDIIFDELGLTQAERNEVYWSVAELVKQRLDKAASR